MGRTPRVGPLLACLVGVSCTGWIEGGDETASGSPTGSEPGSGPAAPEATTLGFLCEPSDGVVLVGRTPLRRLTRAELNNSLSDLLGIDGAPADALAPDERVGPFYSNAIAPITDLLVSQVAEMAARAARAAGGRIGELVPCSMPDGEAEVGACADSFVRQFGKRAFRRPLNDEEVDDYVTLLLLGAEDDGFEAGAELVIEAMLQAPSFLYHVEGRSAEGPTAYPVPLTSYELASRLSYFLWGTMPDEELLAAAEAGLEDPAVLRSHAERMLASDRAKDAIGSFHVQWLGIGNLTTAEKDPELFPDFDALRPAMVAETHNFADYVIRRGDAKLRTLFTAPFSLLEGPLFDFYGVETPDGFTPGEPVPLDPNERAGILTQAGFLAAHSHHNQTSPVHRGLSIREGVLCHTIPPPPPTVDNTPPSPTSARTARERFAQHEANATCASCHVFMDRIGLALENYDAIGAYRTEENGLTIDASGEIVGGAPDVSGTFDGPIELGTRLGESQQVSECVVRQWFRFALGRIESDDDGCSLRDASDRFDGSDHDIRELILSVVESDAFRLVRLVGAEVEGAEEQP